MFARSEEIEDTIREAPSELGRKSGFVPVDSRGEALELGNIDGSLLAVLHLEFEKLAFGGSDFVGFAEQEGDDSREFIPVV